MWSTLRRTDLLENVLTIIATSVYIYIIIIIVIGRYLAAAYKNTITRFTETNILLPIYIYLLLYIYGEHYNNNIYYYTSVYSCILLVIRWEGECMYLEKRYYVI